MQESKRTISLPMMGETGKRRIGCAEYSRTVGEDMAGTAKPSDLWLLLEYRGRWEREADSVLSNVVQSRIVELKTMHPGVRVALIRRPDRRTGPLKVFWAFSRERNAQLFQSELDNYNHLNFDIGAPGEETDAKLFSVCTHGTHDICCAKFGNEIYSRLRELSPNVWEISHVGGCRFAPNVVCLPHGIVYGRVEPENCQAIIASYERGQLIPGKLRGRSCYPKPVQAAERFVRSAKQLTGLDELVLAGARQTGPDIWLVSFRARGCLGYEAVLLTERDQSASYRSCSAADLSRRDMFRLVDLKEHKSTSSLDSCTTKRREPDGMRRPECGSSSDSEPD